ncbi:DUF2066 domain-containing protein [Azospirillum cavernae]|uniref:DUF2066 domain-containing protein n=1 Tax=Azospirillum cavernae TaxID=2320860 RepID=A0A418W472_9PROT|nr:DUF2066 domain-containing protein [Azospirillum cavernae]RJF84788.1 DUF2066 domain-containing protein [Azospirillum cavernae]
MRLRHVLTAALVLSTASLLAQAAEVGPLHEGEAVVTGQDDGAERRRGLAEAMAQVIVRLTGDDALLDDARTAFLRDHPADFVTTLTYEDRLARKKVMDEQGTRERSFRLRVAFDAARVDAALTDAGLRLWQGERPTVLVLLTIRDSGGTFTLSRAGTRGIGQREALMAAAAWRALPLALPIMDPEDAAVIRAGDGGIGPAAVTALCRRYGVDRLLLGRLELTDAGLWRSRWSFDAFSNDAADPAPLPGGASDGLTFDRAIHQAIAAGGRWMARRAP